MMELKVGDKVRKITAKGLSKYEYVVMYLGANADGASDGFVFIRTTGGTGTTQKTPVAKLSKEAA